MIENATNIIVPIIAYYVLILSCSRPLNKQYKNNYKNLILLVIISLVNIYSSRDTNHVIKLFVSISTFFVIPFLIYKENIKKSVIVMFLYFFIVMLSEMIIMLPITALVKNVNYYIDNASILKTMLTLSTTLTVYVILNFRIIKRTFNNIIEYCMKKIATIYFPVVVELMLSVLLIYYINYFSANKHVSLAIIFSISCLFIMIFTVISIYNNRKLKEVNDFLLRNDKRNQEIFEINKQFRHNIIHELNCIKLYGNDKVNEIIDEYIKEHKITPHQQIDTYKIPDGLQGIIYQKIILNDVVDIDIKIDNYLKSEPYNTLRTLSIVRLSECFGIILDNALEAVKNVREKYLYIYLNEEKDKYIIKVVNPINQNLNIDNIIGNSTKPNHLGEGLNYIYKKSKAGIKTLVRNNIFSVTLTIKK